MKRRDTNTRAAILATARCTAPGIILALVQSVSAAIGPFDVTDNSGGAFSYWSRIATEGAQVHAVNLGHDGPDITYNGVTFTSARGPYPSGIGWSVAASAYDDGLGNPGIDDLFFSESWGGNPVTLTVSGLDPTHAYLLQLLHGEPRGAYAATYSNNTLATDEDGPSPVPAFTIGNNVNGDSPPAAEDVALLTTTIARTGGFVYRAYSATTRGPSIAGFQVRDLGPASLVTATAADGAGSLRQAMVLADPNDPITFAPELSGATINLGGSELVAARNLVIDASSLHEGVTVDAFGSSRVLRILAGVSCTLDSLILRGGRSPDGANGAGGDIFGNLPQPGHVGEGGAGVLNQGSLVVRNCSLVDNVTGRGGLGGGYVLSTLRAPSGDGGPGAGLYNQGDAELVNCTLYGNRTGDGGTGTTPGTPGSGGGLHNEGTLTLTFCTVSANQTGLNVTNSVAGGGISSTGTLHLRQSIVAGNTGAPAAPDFRGHADSVEGVNFVGSPTGASGLGTEGTNYLTGDPGLLPLDSYGGPTPTLHPALGSPVLDPAGGLAAGPGDTDQRGAPRLTGAAVDIGAVELRLLDLVVTTTDNDGPGSLRDALRWTNTSPFPSTIAFDPALSGATILLAGQALPVDGEVNIDASPLPEGVILDGNNASRVMDVAAGAQVTMEGLTLTRGRTPDTPTELDYASASAEPGAGLLNRGALVLRHCVVTGNRTGSSGSSSEDAAGHGGDGGGLWNEGTLELVACTVSSNFTGNGGSAGEGSSGRGGDGAGIWNSGTLTLSGFTCEGNRAGNGGQSYSGSRGGHGGGLFNTGNLTVTDAEFRNNIAGNGGAYQEGRGALGGDGGGICSLGGGSVRLDRVTLDGNRAGTGGLGDNPHGGHGGGLYASSADIAIRQSTVRGNVAGRGGEQRAGGPSGAGGNGGGVALSTAGGSAEVLLEDLILSANQAGQGGPGDSQARGGNGGHGGGLWTDRNARVVRCTIEANRAGHGVLAQDGAGGHGGQGGGIAAHAALTVEDSTIHLNVSGNGADARNDEGSGGTGQGGHGGGLYAAGPLVLRNSTVAYNTSGKGGSAMNTRYSPGNGGSGGGIHAQAGASVMHATIVGNRTGIGGTDSAGSPTAQDGRGGGLSSADASRVSLVHSIVCENLVPAGPENLFPFGGFGEWAGNLVDRVPSLTPLGDWGGPTPTMLPLPDSPAVDLAAGGSATPPATDQRGLPRVHGARADAGAVEFTAAPDLPRVWFRDQDGDGLPYGAEFALGTDDFDAQEDAGRLFALYAGKDGRPVITFSLNPDAEPYAVWILERSTDMVRFDPVYVYDPTSRMESIPETWSHFRTARNVTLFVDETETRGFFRLVFRMRAY